MPSLEHYRDMSDSALEKEAQKLQREQNKLGDELDRIAQVRDERFTQARAAALLEGLTSGERDVLIEAAVAQAKVEAKAPGGEG